jgi:hypothetical protein
MQYHDHAGMKVVKCTQYQDWAGMLKSWYQTNIGSNPLVDDV